MAPGVLTVWMSLHDWPLLGTPTFIGLRNFTDLLSDKQFLSATGFTLEFALLLIPVLFVVGLVLALLLESSGKTSTVVRTAIFLPVSLGFASASYLWLSLLNPRVGAVDKVFQDLGIIAHPVNWFDAPVKALMVVMLVTVWKFSGFSMVAFINGLHAVPADIEEAARMDGAGTWRIFFSIKLPMLKQTIAFVLTFLAVTAFLTFDQFYVLTAGGPRNSTITLVYWIYNTSFIQNDLGAGSAMSIVFLAILGGLTSVQLFLLRGKVDA